MDSLSNEISTETEGSLKTSNGLPQKYKLIDFQVYIYGHKDLYMCLLVIIKMCTHPKKSMFIYIMQV